MHRIGAVKRKMARLSTGRAIFFNMLYLLIILAATFLIRVRNSFVGKGFSVFVSKLSTKLSTVIVDKLVLFTNPWLGRVSSECFSKMTTSTCAD